MEEIVTEETTMVCCQKPDNTLTAEEFLSSGSDNKVKSLYDIISGIDDECAEIKPINLEYISDLCKEVSEVTTLKRLALIEDIDAKFEKAFITFSMEHNFKKNYNRLVKIFGSCSSEVEFDYFTALNVRGDSNE